MQPQPVEDRLSAGRHPLMLGLGLVGGGDRHHFHLVELMLANKPACVAPGGACFRPETGGQRCKPQRQRGPVHYLLAADSLGAADAMIAQAVAYAGQREQFGRVIGSFQAVKHMCAEMTAKNEPCRSLVWYAAHAVDAAPEEAALMACHAKRSEEHTSELQSLMRISYAVFCLKKNKSTVN